MMRCCLCLQLVVPLIVNKIAFIKMMNTKFLRLCFFLNRKLLVFLLCSISFILHASMHSLFFALLLLFNKNSVNVMITKIQFTCIPCTMLNE